MDTVDVLFIAADPRELDGAQKFWRNVRRVELPVHWSRAGIWKDRRVVAIANGAGRVRAAQAAGTVPYRKLCNIGFCGALDQELKVGDIVVADGQLRPRTSFRHTVGRLASIDRIAQTAAEKERLRAGGAIAVDMEAAGFAKLPCYCIKSVSDLAGETFANDFNAVLRQDGRIGVSRLLWNACGRPFTRFPELKRLLERSRVASRSLGEFLDSCEF